MQIQEKVEKLKNRAANLELLPPEREKAIKALGNIRTKEGALALLDIAGDTRLLPSMRGIALDQARKILRSL